jgi:DNA-binding transcriptional MocR family regulator
VPLDTLSRGTPVFRRVWSDLRAQILSNEFPGETPLPTEAVVAAKYSVSRQTVRRAFQELVVEDLVFRIPGRGTFATPTSVRYLGSLGPSTTSWRSRPTPSFRYSVSSRRWWTPRARGGYGSATTGWSQHPSFVSTTGSRSRTPPSACRWTPTSGLEKCPSSLSRAPSASHHHRPAGPGARDTDSRSRAEHHFR